ncbi:MAG: peptide-methionine (S)-S-oxide reductase MsrA [Alphaproteobacteria bacterium]|nr:peptide-methionine (S)-S-oxide reductase MsrA [Alphaproteobacteria bacterium]
MRALLTLGFMALGAFTILFAQYPWLPQALAGDSLLHKGSDLKTEKPEGYPVAYFAGGCFWCTESEFRGLEGVLFTRAGYAGGTLENPRYEDTHDGKSGHAEAIEVTYAPKKTSYRDLVSFFLTKAHDPTQLNRQGADVGPQYRSALFPMNEEEQKNREEEIARLTAEKLYDKPIVTTIEPNAHFWPAEDYHQQYFEKYYKTNGRDHINVILEKQEGRL